MRTVIALLFSLTFTVTLCAEDKPEVGAYAPRSIVGHFVAGPVISVQSDICPTLYERDECKIALFTRDVKPSQCDLAAAVDEMVRDEPGLKWSFWMVSHENDPTPDDAAWEKTLNSLTAFAKDRRVTSLSIGALIRIPDKSQITRARKSVGVFDGSQDSVVMLIVPDEKKHYGQIRYVRQLDSSKLTTESIAEVRAELAAEWKKVTESK
ncbi:MAG: hypothetical protein U0892_13140 [Pirellulales bacterium]